MKLLAIADTHLGLKVGRTANTRKFIADQMFNSFCNVLDIAKKEKVEYVIHGGDVFNRSNPEKKEISRLFTKIEDLLNDDIGFVMVPGNHDRAHLPDSLLRFYYDNYYSFNKFSEFTINGSTIIGFPFEYKSPRTIFNKVLKKVQQNPKRKYIALCHQLFFGATFGPHNFRFTLQNDVINPTKVPDNLDLIISGHIHKAQSLSKGKVVYPGSTERTHYVEIIEPKGYLLIDSKEDSTNVNFKKLESSPMKVLEYNIEDTKIPFHKIDDDLGSPKCRTLVRFYGRKMNSEEIKSCYVRYSVNEWPLLSFSPTKTDHELKALYSNYNESFQF